MKSKVTADEACAHNCMMIEKLARHMARIVEQRINEGDINLVCQAGECLADACHFAEPSVGCIILLLSECDATRWLDFIMVYCGGMKRRYLGGRYTASDLLKIITGRDRQEWLDYERKTCRHPDYDYA